MDGQHPNTITVLPSLSVIERNKKSLKDSFIPQAHVGSLLAT